MQAVNQSAELLVQRYAREAVECLRQAHTRLQMVEGISTIQAFPWAGEARVWSTGVGQIVALMESTELDSATALERDLEVKRTLTTLESIEEAGRNRRTLVIRVQRIDGEREDIEVEPYSVRDIKQQPTLVCFNVAHNHIERLPLHRILYALGAGSTFEPRFDIEFDKE